MVSTELATANGTAPAVVAQTASPLVQWVSDARAVQAVAEHIAQSTFVPNGLRGKAVEVMVAMLAGAELGMQPMATLRSIDVIQGTPSLRAHAMRGLVLSHGHEVEVVEADAEHCVMRGRRKGSQTWQTVTWDLARAKAMGLLGREQWKNQPQTMLVARATGEICRLIAADVLYAMPYASEEREDEPVRATATVTAAALVGPPETFAEPALRDVSDSEPPADEQLISGPLNKKLHTLLGQTGRGDRDTGLEFLSREVGRELTSSKALTRLEALAVVEKLEREIEAKAQEQVWPEVTQPADANGEQS